MFIVEQQGRPESCIMNKMVIGIFLLKAIKNYFMKNRYSKLKYLLFASLLLLVSCKGSWFNFEGKYYKAYSIHDNHTLQTNRYIIKTIKEKSTFYYFTATQEIIPNYTLPLDRSFLVYKKDLRNIKLQRNHLYKISAHVHGGLCECHKRIYNFTGKKEDIFSLEGFWNDLYIVTSIEEIIPSQKIIKLK